MSAPSKVFHLAIPSANLQDSKRFYQEVLGCEVAREYEDRITVNFFGDQVVCHLSPDGIDTKPKMYPRHFGVTFRDRKPYDEVLTRAKELNANFFQEEFTRFGGKTEEHSSFFLIDPSNNLIEFKHYVDPAMMY